MHIQSLALTDVGRKRKHNEDNFLVNDSLRMYAVADGMGGHNAGEVASAMALDILSSYVASHRELLEIKGGSLTSAAKRAIFDMLDEGVQRACQQIYDLGQNNPDNRGMGTTLSALVLTGNAAFIAHVGDSRVYLYRKNKTYLLTEDHTLLNEHLKRGLITREEAVNFPHKNVITRAVGVMAKVPADTFFLEVAEGDRFLLCSDGLHGYTRRNADLDAFLALPKLEDIPSRLIEFANESGGKDNITTVVLSATGLTADGTLVDVSQRMDVLQQVALFEYLEYQDIVNFLNAAVTSVYEKGQVVVKEGEAGDCFYVILSGGVEITQQGVFITSLEKGGHFGEMALIDDSPRSATVRAGKQTLLLEVKRQDFHNLISSHPTVAGRVLLNISRTLSQRLRETTQAFATSRKMQLKDTTVII